MWHEEWRKEFHGSILYVSLNTKVLAFEVDQVVPRYTAEIDIYSSNIFHYDWKQHIMENKLRSALESDPDLKASGILSIWKDYIRSFVIDIPSLDFFKSLRIHPISVANLDTINLNNFALRTNDPYPSYDFRDFLKIKKETLAPYFADLKKEYWQKVFSAIKDSRNN